MKERSTEMVREIRGKMNDEMCGEFASESVPIHLSLKSEEIESKCLMSEINGKERSERKKSKREPEEGQSRSMPGKETEHPQIPQHAI